jgi:hypothetical protein
MSAIVDFYLGRAPDYRGRRLADIWRWDHDRLEETHDYIQVLFPSVEPSRFNARAPLLDEATIAAFRGSEELRRNLATSLDVMLRFYGLARDPATGRVVRGPAFAERAANWLTPCDHNFLRITRILKSLVALGLPDHARAFFDCLADIYTTHAAEIGPETFAFWKAAVAEAGSPT